MKNKIYCELIAKIDHRLSMVKNSHIKIISFYEILSITDKNNLEKILLDKKYLQEFVEKNINRIFSLLANKNLPQFINNAWEMISTAFQTKTEKKIFSKAHFRSKPLALMQIDTKYLEKILVDNQIFKMWSVLWQTGLASYFECELDSYKDCWKEILQKKNLESLVDAYKEKYGGTRNKIIEKIQYYALLEISVTKEFVEKEVQRIAKAKIKVLGFTIRLENTGKSKIWAACKAYGSGVFNKKFKIYISGYAKLPKEDDVQNKIIDYFRKHEDKFKILEQYDKETFYHINSIILSRQPNGSITEKS